MEKKYKTEKVGNMLRIIALKDFSNVKKGDRGGLIEKEENLSQIGDCWVYEEAWVYGNAVISDNAKIYEKASVGGIARVFGCACVSGNARVYGSAMVYGSARIYGNVKLHSPVNRSFVSLSIKDSKDYVILAIKKDFYIISLPNNIINQNISIVEERFINNIKTIRQLYGKEV